MVIEWNDRREGGNFSSFEIEATLRVLLCEYNSAFGDIHHGARLYSFDSGNNELLISHPAQRECFQECFQGIQALEKFQVPETRRVGVSEIGCNTKPLQTVRANPVDTCFHPRVLLPLRRQEFLISPYF